MKIRTEMLLNNQWIKEQIKRSIKNTLRQKLKGDIQYTEIHGMQQNEF